MSGESRFAPSARAAATWMPAASTTAMEQRRLMLRILAMQVWSRCRPSSRVSGAAMVRPPQRDGSPARARGAVVGGAGAARRRRRALDDGEDLAPGDGLEGRQ